MTTTAPSPAWWPLLWHSGALAMAVLGPDRRYVAVNEALCHVLEADASTLLEWGYERVGHPLDLDTELDAFVRLAEGALAVSYVRRFRSAREREWLATVQVVAGSDGQFLQVIIPGQASARPDQGAAELRLAELAAALSHDAQEPVRQLGVSAGLLGQRLGTLLDGREREQQLLHSMEHNAVKLGRQLRGLVPYARLGPAVIDPAPCVLRDLAHEALTQVTIPTTITTHNTVAATLRVHCDPAQIITALVELLRNASTTRAAGRPTTITIAATVTDGHCLLSVTDDGVGIAPLDCPRLFRLFAAIGPGSGAGMGLALVRAVAEGHGGRAWIESVLGSGATVSLSIPA